MQVQADVIDVKVERPQCIETTAMGAAYLAGLAVGYWQDKETIKKNHVIAQSFTPDMDSEKRKKLLRGWHRAVRAACIRLHPEE